MARPSAAPAAARAARSATRKIRRTVCVSSRTCSLDTGSAKQVGEAGGECAERLAAMAQRVLLLRGHLRRRPLLPHRDEDRVVAEPVGAARLADERTIDLPFDDELATVRRDRCGHTDERRSTSLVRHV